MSYDVKCPHYLIVGAGVAGCSLAYELSKHPVKVTLIDAGAIGQGGASAVPVALLNPHRGRTGRASELDKAGLNVIWDIVAELEQLGFWHGVHPTDILRIASSEKQAKLWQKLEGVRWLDLQEIPRIYHAPFGGIVIKGGWLEPKLFLRALVNVAIQRGVVVIENQQVIGIERVPGRIQQQVVSGLQRNGENRMMLLQSQTKLRSQANPPLVADSFKVLLRTSNNLLKTETQTLTADVVILCVGTNQIEGVSWPALEHFAGDVVTFDANVNLPFPIAGAIYGLQHNQRVFIGGNHREHIDDPTAVQQLQKSSRWFIPALKEAKVLSKWTGTRARKEDNQPLFAELAPNLIFFGALGGRGFLCSSYLAKTLVESLLGL